MGSSISFCFAVAFYFAMELADDSVELTIESDVDEKSESVELSGFTGDFEDSEDEKPRVGVRVRPPRSNGLSTIDEESHVPSSTGRSFSVNSSMVSRLNRNSTTSAIVCARDLETICEEQKSLISQFSSSYISNRPTKHTKPNHSQLSASSSATFSRSRIRNRLEALKPVERLDYSTIMSSLNLRSVFFKQKQQAQLSEEAVNRLPQMSEKSTATSIAQDLPSSTDDNSKRDVENCLQIKPSILAFGFVDVKKSHCIQLTIQNSFDRSVCFEPSILCDKKGGCRFRVEKLVVFYG
ncbi:hypothetical protein M3Y94_01251100 [Aphelenchoides besseyi]|nr:hypothetical protein M3Y94_01251100 [Aphelenchoides besseyi]